MNEYIDRISEKILDEKIEAMGVVVIEGPKFCGKTTLAKKKAASVLDMGDPEGLEQKIALARTNIKILLKGNTPRLIDEWQIVPQFWDAVRNEVDKRNKDGQFILTGSAVPVKRNQIYHTGTGRMSWLKLRTMTLWESGDSSGDVSLERLFDKSYKVEGISSLTLERLAFLTCRGGWPKAVVKSSERAALLQAKEYFTAVTKYDISRVDDIQRDEEIAKRLMRSYARHQGAQATIGTIMADIKGNEKETIGENTIYSYIRALKQIFVIEDSPAWNPNLRSKSAIRTSDTRYYTDPSIGTAALGLGPKDLINDMNTFGLLFETLCIRDLRVYASMIEGEVYHFRDSNGLECDAVIHLPNSEYGLIEIKIGGNKLIDEGAATLKKLANTIDTTKMKAPSFMMVLTGIGEYAYQREDDVLVVPIGSLKY